MKQYKHIFFDLDGTLWDLYKNTELALRQLILEFGLEHLSFEKFYQHYHHHNEIAWTLYREGKIKKEVLRTERFSRAFGEMGMTESTEFYERFAERFLEICPALPHRVEGAIELLNSLKGRYQLHIITNGFKEVQGIKMKAAGIDHFFQEIINSEDAGVKKPDRGIYEFALQKANALPEHSIMIGDDWEADIIGARDFGIDQVFLTKTERMQSELRGSTTTLKRHNYKPTLTVDDLHELISFF